MKDQYTKTWITDNAIEICSRYELGELTIRGLHYQLVALGMTNSLQHYKRVGDAMTQARWEGLISFEQFSDHDREMLGWTHYLNTDLEEYLTEAKTQVGAWMNSYSKKRWENQPYYPEVFIEKKALQGTFSKPCKEFSVGLGACKGYSSLTFLNEAAKRFQLAVWQGKKPIILYFGDHDPSGDDIPRSLVKNIKKLGCPEIELRRFALNRDQVIEWNLPPAPVKVGDSRAQKWDGLGQVELDAVDPRKLQQLCTDAISSVFDESLYSQLLTIESDERTIFRHKMLEFVQSL